MYLYQTRDLAITYGGKHHVPLCTPAMDAIALAASHGLMTLSDASWGVPKPHVGGHAVMYMGATVNQASGKPFGPTKDVGEP